VNYPPTTEPMGGFYAPFIKKNKQKFKEAILNKWAQVQPNLKTYVITTTPDLLDDLIGKGGNDIDDLFLKFIKDNL